MTESTAAASAQPTPESRKLRIDGVGYYFFDRGEARPRAPVLVGLHGGAQTAPEFLQIVRKIAPPDWAVAAPQGFNQLWNPPKFDRITFSWLTSYEKEDSIERNNRFIASTLDELAAEGAIDPARVFMLGFSQGCSVVYRFAQHYPNRVRGVISVCSDLPPDVEANLAPMRDTRVLILYGLKDNIMPPARSEHALAALQAGGVEAEAIAFDRGHLVPASLAPQMQDWMNRTLAGDLTKASS